MFFKGSELSYTELVCNGMMSVRFLRPVRQGQAILLVLPGGPALASTYLDGFLNYAASSLQGMNIGVIDLPNHGTAFVPKDKLPLIYPECLDLVEWAIRDVKKRASDRVVFLGHSLGCRLLLDLIADKRASARAALFVNPLFHDYDEAKNLAVLWKLQVLKFAATELGQGEFRELVTKMSWVNNEEIFAKLKPVKETLKKVAEESFPIAIVEGEWDPYRMSQPCRLAVEGIFKRGGYGQVPASSHFSPLEHPDLVLEFLKQVCSSLVPLTESEPSHGPTETA